MKRVLVIALLSSLLGGCVSTMGGTSASDAPYRGIGYATVSNQPGKTLAQKQLMAIRASRLMAMRDLAEKIHGLNVDAYTSVAEGTMLNDSLRGSVMGLVRGARVVSITPTRSNVYETILEVDASEVSATRGLPRAPAYR